MLSVRMPIWAPVMLMALWPSEWMAIAISATVTCSPVDRSMSNSRAGGSSAIRRARPISRSVSSPMALRTITTWLPSFWARIAFRAAARIFSAVGHAGAAKLLDDDGHGRSGVRGQGLGSVDLPLGVSHDGQELRYHTQFARQFQAGHDTPTGWCSTSVRRSSHYRADGDQV